MKTARFWVYWNQTFARIVLSAGEDVSFHCSEDTDEGWSSKCDHYSFDGDTVTLSSVTRGRDCDGLLERFFTADCLVNELAASEPNSYTKEEYPYIGKVPAWKEIESHQRDHSAEAAGY